MIALLRTELREPHWLLVLLAGLLLAAHPTAPTAACAALGGEGAAQDEAPAIAMGEAPAAEPAIVEEPYRTRIVWRDESKSEARFLPEQVLNDVPTEELPISSAQRSALQYRINSSLLSPPADLPEIVRERAFLPPCVEEWFSKVEPPDSYERDQSLEEFIGAHQVALIGRIVGVVPSWDVRSADVTDLTYVEIESVLRDMTERLQIGSVYYYPTPGGELFIGRARLCEARAPEYFQPVAGDRVLVLAAYTESLGDGLEFRAHLPIRDGAVLPQPYLRLEQTSRSLNSLEWGRPLSPQRR